MTWGGCEGGVGEGVYLEGGSSLLGCSTAPAVHQLCSKEVQAALGRGGETHRNEGAGETGPQGEGEGG